ncbi:unnamed protein product, partial [Polarella glacialis]
EPTERSVQPTETSSELRPAAAAVPEEKSTIASSGDNSGVFQKAPATPRRSGGASVPKLSLPDLEVANEVSGNSTPRSARSGASSRRSGMTEAEVDEMREMAGERSRKALREALLLLRVLWAKSQLPPAEAVSLRKRLRKAKTLRASLRAAKNVASAIAPLPWEDRAPEVQLADLQKEALELALAWERCRTRALIALAVLSSGSAGELRAALSPAAKLGLSVDLERDLCDELEALEARALQPSREPSEASLGASTGESGDERRQLEEEPETPPPLIRRGWMSWWPWSKTRQMAFSKWEGDEDLLQVVKDHVRRGNRPLPHELAVELGLAQPVEHPESRKDFAETTPSRRTGLSNKHTNQEKGRPKGRGRGREASPASNTVQSPISWADSKI